MNIPGVYTLRVFGAHPPAVFPISTAVSECVAEILGTELPPDTPLLLMQESRMLCQKTIFRLAGSTFKEEKLSGANFKWLEEAENTPGHWYHGRWYCIFILLRP